jgi:hypothetical protein
VCLCVFYARVFSAVKTGPSFTDAAMGRIAQISKVISEGGYDKIFQQTFECLPDEKLKKPYACYLSTTHGPIMGVLYVSTAKIAFGSDSPVKYVTEDNISASSFYKVCHFREQILVQIEKKGELFPMSFVIEMGADYKSQFYFRLIFQLLSIDELDIYRPFGELYSSL